MIVLVGEAPGPGTVYPFRPGLNLTGSTGKNLCAIAGWDWTAYLRDTRRHNLFMTPMPRWPAGVARRSAEAFQAEFAGTLPLILLGAKVAEAFRLGDEPLYTWLHEDWANVARIPHPSGLNRMWNDPAERARARAFLERLL